MATQRTWFHEGPMSAFAKHGKVITLPNPDKTVKKPKEVKWEIEELINEYEQQRDAKTDGRYLRGTLRVRDDEVTILPQRSSISATNSAFKFSSLYSGFVADMQMPLPYIPASHIITAKAIGLTCRERGGIEVVVDIPFEIVDPGTSPQKIVLEGTPRILLEAPGLLFARITLEICSQLCEEWGGR
ncbi:unnamed protein product [Penicillium pancosmium]